MNIKTIALVALGLAVLVGVYLGLRQSGADAPVAEAAVAETGPSADPGTLVRFHSPVMGPANAPVTLVEFFDPACEACSAFYPIVKDLLNRHPQDVRLVLRYAPFHTDSDKAVRLLEASRAQGKYWEVLEALLATQAMWADHGRPNIELAYKAAEQAGLDLARAHADAAAPQIDALLEQEMKDLVAHKIERTPTFFINGEKLTQFGPQQLAERVAKAVAETRSGAP